MRFHDTDLTSPSQFKLARKILKKDEGPEADWEKERKNLQAFTRERHPNIVKALSFYDWKGYINFVFPFINYTLEDILTGKWKGPDKAGSEVSSSPRHWLWVQMVGIGDALKTIHNPKAQATSSGNEQDPRKHEYVSPSLQDMGPERRIVGFHFDLKPANILVTDKGQLQISDFGLSLVKEVNPGSASYGLFRGGALRYLAPELSPSHGMTSSEATQTTSYHEIPDKFKNRCDVWSYAGVTLEVTIHLFKLNDPMGLAKFRKALDSEGLGCAFHSSNILKQCVKRELEQLIDQGTAKAESSNPEAWRVDLKKCLEAMFEIEPRQRLSSHDVVAELRGISDKYNELPGDDLSHHLMRFQNQEYPEETFDCVYWGAPDDKKLFLHMLVFHPLFTKIWIIYTNCSL